MHRDMKQTALTQCRVLRSHCQHTAPPISDTEYASSLNIVNLKKKQKKHTCMHIHSNRREEGAEKFDDVEALLVPCRNAGGGGGGDWMEFWIKQSLNSDSLHAASVLYSLSSHFWHRVPLGLGWKDKLYETSYWKATQDVLNSKLPLDHFCSQCVPLQDQKCLDVIIIDAMEQLLSWLTSQNLIK